MLSFRHGTVSRVLFVLSNEREIDIQHFLIVLEQLGHGCIASLRLDGKMHKDIIEPPRNIRIQLPEIDDAIFVKGRGILLFEAPFCSI